MAISYLLRTSLFTHFNIALYYLLIVGNVWIKKKKKMLSCGTCLTKKYLLAHDDCEHQHLSLAPLNNDVRKKQTKITRRKTDVHLWWFYTFTTGDGAYNVFFFARWGREDAAVVVRLNEMREKTQLKRGGASYWLGNFWVSEVRRGWALREHRVCPGSTSLR